LLTLAAVRLTVLIVPAAGGWTAAGRPPRRW